jgi:hypothetical protein
VAASMQGIALTGMEKHFAILHRKRLSLSELAGKKKASRLEP